MTCLHSFNLAEPAFRTTLLALMKHHETYVNFLPATVSQSCFDGPLSMVVTPPPKESWIVVRLLRTRRDGLVGETSVGEEEVLECY